MHGKAEVMFVVVRILIILIEWQTRNRKNKAYSGRGIKRGGRGSGRSSALDLRVFNTGCSLEAKRKLNTSQLSCLTAL